MPPRRSLTRGLLMVSSLPCVLFDEFVSWHHKRWSPNRLLFSYVTNRLYIIIYVSISGWSDFSAKTEENEEKLFGLVKNMTSRLQPTDDKRGGKTFLRK